MPSSNDQPNSPISPHLTVSDAAEAIEFYKKAFGAEEVDRHAAPDGKRIMHAKLLVNGGTLLLNDDFPEYSNGQSNTPQASGGVSTVLHLQVSDADTVYNQALAAGATVRFPLADQFWGDRYGQLKDPFGHVWSIGSKKRDVSPEELQEGAKRSFSAGDEKMRAKT